MVGKHENQKTKVVCYTSDTMGERMVEAVARRCPVKQVFLETPQNSKKNTCTIAFF